MTNYGLAGSCESHTDPYGYLSGLSLTPERRDAVYFGDYIATFMAWLGDVPAGGATGFTYPEYEDVIEPVKGGAAFWTDLSSGNHKDHRSMHAGCPTLSGSKWILNKCKPNL